MIMMDNVCKSYRIAKRNGGFQEAVKALFHREYEEIHAHHRSGCRVQTGSAGLYQKAE